MKLHYLFPFFLLITLFSPFLGCENEPLIVYEEIIIRDTITETITDTTTTFILVRHAETIDATPISNLSLEGMERAEDLVGVIDSVMIAGIYAQDSFRTSQTVAPLALDKDLVTMVFDSASLEVMADSIITAHYGEVALVVGDSITTIDLLNILTGAMDYDTIANDVYNDLFIVSTLEKGRSTVIQTKYGK